MFIILSWYLYLCSPESCRHCPGASGGDCNGDQFGMKNVSIIETMFLQWFFYQGTCWGSTWPYRWWVLATEEFAGRNRMMQGILEIPRLITLLLQCSPQKHVWRLHKWLKHSVVEHGSNHITCTSWGTITALIETEGTMDAYPSNRIHPETWSIRAAIPISLVLNVLDNFWHVMLEMKV